MIASVQPVILLAGSFRWADHLAIEPRRRPVLGSGDIVRSYPGRGGRFPRQQAGVLSPAVLVGEKAPKRQAIVLLLHR